jgi:type I restriction enzyme M protein
MERSLGETGVCVAKTLLIPSTPPAALLKQGYIVDFITGELIRDTSEERDAVQIFARRLVEDYEYPKDEIQTHPQYRVRKRPSDEERSYPIDIAVFRDSNRIEDNLYLIVECKKQNRKDGTAQLKLYMDMSPAELGVWFNGEDHVYLRKVIQTSGRRLYQELPNIPRKGQRVEDVGLFKRRDLRKASNLKAVFKDLRNHLAGNVTGITRDEALAQEIINILFCKIYDEVNTGKDEIVTFRCGQDEPPDHVRKRIIELFKSVKETFSDVFTESDTIKLDGNSIVYVVGELQNYCITEADRDAVGDAFEVFIGPALRGTEGQFFTPRNVVKMVIEILDPNPGQMILDPACGSGGFLIMALEHVWRKLELQAKDKGWTDVRLAIMKREVAIRTFRGLDKDSFLAKVTKAYMAIVGDGKGGIFCENSLLPLEQWHHTSRDAVKLGVFDVVLTNPPFGTQIPIKGQAVLSQYDLARKWRKNKLTGGLDKTSLLQDDHPPQILFLERCLQFLKRGGRLGIILPESILGNPSYEYVLHWLMERATILAVITMPEALFKTSGKGGTHCKVCVLVVENAKPTESYAIFMADAKWCGHDSRGNPTIRKLANGNSILLDEIPSLGEKYRELVLKRTGIHSHIGFLIEASQLKNRILVPKYYDPELRQHLLRLSSTHYLVRIGDLVQEGALEITTGVEVGKMAYGTGLVPFIRTSDISNWELKADPKQGVAEELYESLKTKLDVRPGDILMVRDGTYLIGTCAIITETDTRILFQSHIYKIRVGEHESLNPWLLFAALNSPVVKKQIRSKQFTQDIIDTLGNRILELLIPVPTDAAKCREIAESTRDIVETRARLRNRAKQIVIAVEGATRLDEEDEELLRI